ncbi:hypothetical protein [Microbulbifer sp. PAAF003]|uniref:hypothetical protein n=1 Tax=Microbulbifer sp. PAAF003 TaxID=3243375 RepID=UPI00403943C0
MNSKKKYLGTFHIFMLYWLVTILVIAGLVFLGYRYNSSLEDMDAEFAEVNKSFPKNLNDEVSMIGVYREDQKIVYIFEMLDPEDLELNEIYSAIPKSETVEEFCAIEESNDIFSGGFSVAYRYRLPNGNILVEHLVTADDCATLRESA